MKTHAFKIVCAILGIVVFVLITTILVLPMLLDLNRYHEFIVSEVEKAVGGTVKLGRISWGIRHRIWIEVDGFSIAGASAFHGDVNLTRIHTSIAMHKLLNKKIVVQNVKLEGPEVKFKLEPALNGTRPPVEDKKSADFHLPVEIEIRQIVLKVKQFVFSDAKTAPGQTLVHLFSDVELTATNIAPAKVMAFNLSLRDNSPTGLGALKAQGTFRGLTKTLTLENPKLHLAANLEAVQVDALTPYLKNNQFRNQLSGSIAMKASCDVDLTENNLHTQGVIDLSNIIYKDPSRWEAALPGQLTTIAFQINLDPKNLTAEKIAFKLGSLSLVARAELHDWKTDPIMAGAEISADLPLLDMMPLVPWKLLGNNTNVIRSILKGGGKIVFNKITFPDIYVAKPPATANDLLSGIEMTAQLTGISVKPSPNAVKLEGIEGAVALENNVLVAENIHSRVGPIALPPLSIHVAEIASHPRYTIRANGPLQVAEADDAKIEKFLMQYGLKDLTGSAKVGLQVDFDQGKPEDWKAKGMLELKGIRAETHPARVVLENMEGVIQFNRDKVIKISAKDLSARINQAFVRMSGRFLNVGEPDMLIATKVYANHVVLSHLAEFIPSLKALELKGNLDMNVDVHIPYATPVKSRLTGTLTTRNIGFQLAAADMHVENGNTQIVLAGNSAAVKTMTMNINDQKLAVSGRLSNPVKPDVKLLITSPDLNLDRLLSQKKAAPPPPTRQKGPVQKPALEMDSAKRELPPLVRKLTANLTMKAEQGRYSGLPFQNLNLNVLYKHGVIERYDFHFGVDQGNFHTKGNLDLRDLDRVTFSLNPDIAALRMEKLATVFGIEKPPFYGPISLAGQLQGHTGSRQELIASLIGNLELEMGPGSCTEGGRTMDLFLKILSMTSVRGFFSGHLVDDISEKGLSFQKIKSQNSFNKGIMTLKDYHLISDAILLDLYGKINLIDERLDLIIALEPLREVDTAIGKIPLFGKTTEDLTKIYLEVKGPFERPEIRPASEERIGKEVKTGVKASETIVNDVVKGIKKIY